MTWAILSSLPLMRPLTLNRFMLSCFFIECGRWPGGQVAGATSDLDLQHE